MEIPKPEIPPDGFFHNWAMAKVLPPDLVEVLSYPKKANTFGAYARGNRTSNSEGGGADIPRGDASSQ